MKLYNTIWQFAIIIFLLVPLPAYSIIKQYNQSDGLISNNVYSVYKDNSGRLWFCTDRGLNVFDGQRFKSYTMLDGLDDNEIFQVSEDKEGRLWVCTYNGGGCFIINDTVHNRSNDPIIKQLPTNSYINAFAETGDSDIYLGYYNGEIYKIHGNNVKKLHVPVSVNTAGITSIYIQHDTIHVIAIRTNITIIKDEITVKDIGQYHKGYKANGMILTTDSLGIKIYRGGGNLQWEYDSPLFSSNNVINLYLDNGDNLFCGTYNGLTIFNTKDRQEKKLFTDTKVTCTAQDINGNYWVTTIGNGVYKLNKEQEHFECIGDLTNSRIFYTTNKQLFIANKDTTWQVENNRLLPLPIPLPAKYEPVYNNSSFFFYSDGIYTNIYNKHNKKNFKEKIFLKLCFESFNGYYWAVSGYGINRLKPGNSKPDIQSVKTFANRIIAAQYDSIHQSIYCISGAVLYAYDVENNRLKTIDSFTNSLPVGLYLCNKQLIVQLNNKSIAVYNIENYSHYIYTGKDIIFYSFVQLTDTSVLLNTNKGYYISGNLTGREHWNNMQKLEYPIDEKSTMLLYPAGQDVFCKINSLGYLFDKHLINKELTTPTFIISKITLNGQAYNTNTISFPALKSCDLSVYLTAPNFNNTPITFQYRICSSDTTAWFDNEGYILNLHVTDYGKQAIHIRAITENGRSSPIKTLSVEVLPPFYKTPWFTVLMIIVILLLSLSLIFTYIRLRKRKFRQELNYMQLEHKAINSLLNPHFVFNAINNIQGVVAENQPGKANEYLAMLSRLIRQNIQNLAFNAIPLSKEIILIENYIKLQNLRYQNRIHLELFNAVVYPEKIFIPPLLIHTFVENSVVHGFDMKNEHFEINIEIEMGADEYLRIYITDNGKGFNPKPANSGDKISMGIEFTRKRLTRISEFYGVKSTLDIVNLAETGGRGTKVTILIFSRLGESMTDVLK